MQRISLKLATTTFLILLSVLLLAVSAIASPQASAPLPPYALNPNGSKPINTSVDDGYAQLPDRLKGFSYSTLVMSGLVHPPFMKGGPVTGLQLYRGLMPNNLYWSDPVNISNENRGDGGSTEPATAMHPSNPWLALSAGNTNYPNFHTRIENTSNGGSTWLGRDSPNNSYGDGVITWLGPVFKV